MLHGLIVFNADSGALLYQRRFVRGFGLPGALREPSLADPVGLALQLFAFSRFGRELPGAPQLDRLTLGGDNGSATLAHGEVPEPSGSGQRVPLVLVLFGECPPDLARRLADGLLEAFVAEQGRIADSVATAGAASSSAAVSRPPPRRGGQPTWRFRSLDAYLEEVPDWLIADVAGHLPCQPAWLALLYREPDAKPSEPDASSNGQATGSASAAATPPDPRPPAEPPPSARGSRPPLARRVLFTVSGGRFGTPPSPREPSTETPSTTAATQQPSTPRVVPEAPPGPRPPSAGRRPARPLSAPSRSGGEQQPAPPGTEEPASAGGRQPRASSVAQGKVSWWHWRRRGQASSSESPRSLGMEDLTANARIHCYVYDSASPPGSADANTIPGDLACFSQAVLQGAEAAPVSVVTLPPHARPPEHRVAVIAAGCGRLALALPPEALRGMAPGPEQALHAQAEGEDEEEEEELHELAGDLQVEVDEQLRLLACYMGFLVSLSAGPRAASEPRTPR